MYNYLVEFLGATFFIYVILATGNPLAIGAALALVITMTGDISGGHIDYVDNYELKTSISNGRDLINEKCVS